MKGFGGTVCKNVGWEDRWYVKEPSSRSGGLLVGLDEGVTFHSLQSNSYSIQVEYETNETNGKV